jgi:hypothetical protein
MASKKTKKTPVKSKTAAKPKPGHTKGSAVVPPIMPVVATKTVIDDKSMTAMKKNLDGIAKKLTVAGIPTSVTLVREQDLTGGEPTFSLGLNEARRHMTFSLVDQRDLLGTDSPDLDDAVLPVVTVLGLDKKLRQAVINVVEPARTVSQTVSLHKNCFPSNSTKESRRDKFRRNFDTAMPPGTTYEVEEQTLKSKADFRIAKVTASVPASNMYFLVGFDESHMFVSMLPEKATTPKEAHRTLLPVELRKRSDYLRQGEFFFVPISKEDLKRISAKGFHYEIDQALPLMKNGDESDHVADVTLIPPHPWNECFVTGMISNDRHRLFLNGWYRVMINLELPNPGDSQLWD